MEKEKYSIKVDVPQYTPKNVEPPIKELCNTKRYEEMMAAIETIPDEKKELKDFLKFAATRFLEFNYSKIADFYCHQDPEIQEVMEKMALVIIDFNDAIKYGYVELSKSIKEIIAKQEAEEA